MRVCVVRTEYKMIRTALQTRDDLFPLIHYAPVQFGFLADAQGVRHFFFC